MSDAPDMPEDDALAAEYVLRLLDGPDARAFEARLAREPALAERVRAWEASFAGMADDVAEVAPPAGVKASVMRKITGTPAPPAPWWRRWGLAGGLAAAMLVAIILVTPVLRSPDFDPIYHASLASPDGALRIEAGFAPEGSRLKVQRPEGDPRPGRALELWLIADGVDAPISLGVLPDARETILVLDAATVPLVGGATLAVSDEPPGGSPTGQPTGEVLAAAPLEDI